MRLSCFVLFAIVAACLPAVAADEPGLEAPPGFRVSLYAGDELAHDIYSMTIDAAGHVVVSGPGYVKVLLDEDGDGRADGARLFSALPASGAHGMYFDGPDLICTGDNTVLRLRDQDGDGVADGLPEIWAALRHTEHGANGLVRGPDGNFWLICGNDAGVSERQAATPSSPIKHPRCGAVVRFSPTGKPLDVYADGFRNPYDLDFNARSMPTGSATTTCLGTPRPACSTLPKGANMAGCCRAGRAVGTGPNRISTASSGWRSSAAGRRPG